MYLAWLATAKRRHYRRMTRTPRVLRDRRRRCSWPRHIVAAPLPAGSTGHGARPRSDARHHRSRRGARGRRAGGARRSSSTAPRSTTWTAPRTGRSRRWPSTRSPCAAWRAPPRRPARRSCTTAPTSCSTAPRSEPYSEDDAAGAAQHLRGVEAAGRVVRARRAARATCCASRACSASPAGWTGRRGTLDAHRGRPAGAAARCTVFTDRVVSPSYSPDVAAATRHLLDRGARRGRVSLRQRRARHLGRRGAARARGMLGVEPRLKRRSRSDQVTLQGRPAALLRAGARASWRRAGFTMPAWQDALRRWLASRRSATPDRHDRHG